MSTKLIWQSKDNPLDTIEVVYDSIYGMSIDKCMEVLWKYQFGQLIPIEWLRERASRMLDFGEGIERIIQEWQDEQSK